RHHSLSRPGLILGISRPEDARAARACGKDGTKTRRSLLASSGGFFLPRLAVNLVARGHRSAGANKTETRDVQAAQGRDRRLPDEPCAVPGGASTAARAQTCG